MPSNSSKKPRPKHGLRSLQVVVGLLVALVIAEYGFRVRDDGAFPHVNFYLADEELGVRLEPGASETLKLLDNPTTDIRINQAGYRGAKWKADTGNDILVVGDSQVFGLGVEEHQTFSAQLAEVTGRNVLNGGVPTYGPQEYTAVVREVLSKRKPKTVVYVVNFVNDLFENKRPNSERHAVWDGWAVRTETAPKSTSSFPGRRWLYSQSHLVYAWRQWRYSMGTPLAGGGFESEGTWTDLVAQGTETNKAHDAQQGRIVQAVAKQAQEFDQLSARIDTNAQEMDDLLKKHIYDVESQEDSNYLSLQAAQGKPGDIVVERDLEAGRSIRLTAAHIARGVRFRRKLVAKVREKSSEYKTLSGQNDRLRSQQRSLRSQEVGVAAVESTLTPHIREVLALCEENGAELVVVALPIDVMVSDKEWTKYGVEDPPDMKPTRVLLGDLVASSEAMGAWAVDVTGALAQVTVPAFLDGDIHMSPAGHRAVAHALASKLKESRPIKQPRLGLPEGRTRIPAPKTWKITSETSVSGSSKANCETHLIDEWFKASCRSSNGIKPTNIKVTGGGHGEASVMHTKSDVTLLAPLFEGEEFTATFYWETHSQDFVARWPKGRERPLMWFETSVPTRSELLVSPAEERLCVCEEQGEKTTCEKLYGDASLECLDTYHDDCSELLRCVRGHPATLPSCKPGHANAGGAGRCFQLCEPGTKCEVGTTCLPWHGTAVCRPPNLPAKVDAVQAGE